MYRLLASSTTIFLVFVFGTAPVAAQESGSLVINELHYRADQPTEEFVELYNHGAQSVDLGDYQISDDRMNPVPITGESFELTAGRFVVLVRDGRAFEQAFPGVAYIEPASWPILRQTGDASVLYRHGEVVDSVGYEPSWGGYERDVSLERIDPNGPSDHPSNFGSSDGPPTPGEENSIFRLNTDPPEPIFVAARDNHIRLYFDEPLDPQSVQPSAFSIATPGMPSASSLEDNRSEVVLTFHEPVRDPELTIDGLRDVVGNTLRQSVYPIALPPIAQGEEEAGELVINEIMYQPKLDEYDGEPDQVEYIELLNNGDRLLDISGLYRTDRANQHGEADTTFFPADLLGVAPGEYVLIHARRDGVDLAEAFPESATALNDNARIQRESVTLNLRASGDLIKMHRADGAVIDSVSYEPAWHHQMIQDTRGISLERVLPEGRSNDPNNWTSSLHPDGGTPLLPNSTYMDLDTPDDSENITVSPQTFTPGGGGEHTQTAIRYQLDSDDAMVSVRIFDTMGRLVRNLEAARPAGRFEDVILWDGRNDNGAFVRLGIYVVHLEAVLYDADTVENYREPVVVADPF